MSSWPLPPIGIKGVGQPWLEILCCGDGVRYPDSQEVTTCPACGTRFMIVVAPDHLTVSEVTQ